MANGIVAGTSTISGGVLTLTFVVAAGGTPVTNYDITLDWDHSKATLDPATGITGLSFADGNYDGNALIVSSAQTAAINAGGTVLTLRFTLAANVTSLPLTYTGTFNADSTPLALTGVVANNGSLTSNAPATGDVTVTGTLTENQTLTAVTGTIADGDGLGTFSYQWMRSDGTTTTNISGATASQYTLGDADVGKKVTVKVSFTDGHGVVETKTSATPANNVAGVQDLPTGAITVSGNNAKGATLTSVNTIQDADGLPGTLNYQWYANDVAIATNGTGTSYTLTANEVGKDVKLVVSYTDLQGFSNTVTSNVIAAVVDDHLPAGTLAFSPGAIFEDQTLVLTDNVTDTDGVASRVYKWYRADDQAGTNKTLIANASTGSYKMTQADVGKFVSATVTITDSLGNAKTIDSNQLTAAVQNVNDAPAGAVTISNSTRPGLAPQQGDTLAAANTLTDEDGIPANGITYHWFLDNATTAFSSGPTLLLGQSEVGHKITVKAVYTDNQNTTETVASTQTGFVGNVNDAPTGTVDVTGTYTQGQTLTVSSPTLADADGLGTIQYRWFTRTGTDAGTEAEITAARGSTTLVLAQDQVGKVVYAKAVYTDQQGTTETVSSTPPQVSVGNINDAPVSTLAITGSLAVGATLGFSGTITDADGIPANGITYTWKDGNNAVLGTGTTYKLLDADLGKTIKLVATYTDNFTQAETVTVNKSGVVVPNSPATGTVTVAGTVAQNQTLTVSSVLQDADNAAAQPPVAVPTPTYQWFKQDGSNPAEAVGTGTSLTLNQSMVGYKIFARASFTDVLGVVENVDSTATALVANVNDALQGAVTITGTVREDATLTANTDALTDPDGTLTFTYKWFANGTQIQGETNKTLVLGQAQVNKTVTVEVSATDHPFNSTGNTEVRTAATATTVQNVNDPIQGLPTITGQLAQNQTLTASTAGLTDEDGAPTSYTYQWMANNVAITGATASTYKLTQAEVGKAITVKVTGVDQLGSTENATSAASAAIANVDDDPTGVTTIDGALVAGMPLTVNTSRLFDLDNFTVSQPKGAIPTTGQGAPTYQWYSQNADGTNELLIANQTASSFTPDATYKDKLIKVVGTFVDSYGATETFTVTTTSKIYSEDDVKSASGVAGDGNGDGIADSAQDAVISTPFTVTDTTTGTAAATPVFVTLVADSNTEGTVAQNSTAVITTINQETAANAAPDLDAPPPPKMDLPLGIIDFTATTTKQVETFTLFVSANVNINGYWKYDSVAKSYVNLASTPFGGSLTKVGAGADAKWKIVFQIEDNGKFDDNATTGIIKDPGAIAALPLSLVGYAPDVVLTANTHFFF